MTTTSLEPVLDTEKAQRMIDVIEAEVSLQEEHVHILMLQHDALISFDRPLFAALHQRFERLVEKLEIHAKRRARELPSSGELLAEEMQTWPQEMQEDAKAAIDRLREISEQIGMQGPLNKILINNDLKIVSFSLGLMLEAVGKGSQYRNNGAPTKNAGNRLLNRVA